MKDKYDDARRPYGSLSNIDEDDEYNRYDIHSITGQWAPEKRKKAMDIVSVFLKNKNLIKWNSEGDFTLPIYAVNSPLNLDSLLNTLVYARKGSEQEIRNTIKIIKPFFKAI